MSFLKKSNSVIFFNNFGQNEIFIILSIPVHEIAFFLNLFNILDLFNFLPISC